MIFNEIELQVLERIKPKPEEYEHMHRIFNEIKSVIESVLEKYKINAEVTLQGSIAHDTWLSGDRDLDIFVLFPLDWSVEELKSKGFKILLEAAEKIGVYDIRYAEHPYVRVRVDDVEADLVPAFNVKDPNDIRTAVDRTPLHTMYIKKHLPDELKDHVRLLKQFMKGIDVYGAEVKKKGFSGYLVELLVIAYNGFQQVIEAASKWRIPVYVNTIGDEKTFTSILHRLRRRYPESVIYAPDPVDPYRNAAAAVSIHSLVKFIIASKCYLRNPAMEYYFPPEILLDRELLEKHHVDKRCIIVLEFHFKEKLPPENIWGEIQRVADRMVKVLMNNDFKPVDWSYWSDESEKGVIIVELEECRRPYMKIYSGPPYYFDERILNFLRKHIEKKSIGPWIRLDGKIYALSTRKYIEAVDVLNDRVWEYVVAPHLRNVKPGIYRLEEYLEKIAGRRDLEKWLAKFIVKRDPWMEKCIQ